MTSLKNVLMRIVAVFAASGLSVIGAGAIAGVDTVTAVTVAGLTAVAAVVEKLARAFMDDGKLSLDEINAAFSTVDKGAKTVADVEVENRQATDKSSKTDPNYN
jgi:polyhydroxyalkanoate synthesis regulator phasin